MCLNREIPLPERNECLTSSSASDGIVFRWHQYEPFRRPWKKGWYLAGIWSIGRSLFSSNAVFSTAKTAVALLGSRGKLRRHAHLRCARLRRPTIKDRSKESISTGALELERLRLGVCVRVEEEEEDEAGFED